MGMFDSIYEGTGWEVEWQTKAYVATIRDGRVAGINDARIEALPLVGYGGVIIEHGTRHD